jgi:hypothetical protein
MVGATVNEVTESHHPQADGIVLGYAGWQD